MNEYHKSKEELEAERKLVEKARENPNYFGLLYEKYYRQVFVFIYRRTGEEEVCADIVSNTFLKAMLALPKYEFKGVPFSAFLFRIALNEVNMFFRKTKRDRVVSLDAADLKNIIAESREEDSEEKRKMLMKALGNLSAEDMQMIELRFFEKRAFAEVAEILGITENNAKVKTYRILDKLKVLLQKTGGF
ncbi:MAG: RNA polymerase sigma factor [Bacteroidia bacterium]